MSTIASYLSGDHEACDRLFANAEEAAAAGRWDESTRLFDQLRTAVERHFEAEEQVLFPAIEAHMANTMGPTRVMRREHEQIREGLDELAGAVQERDASRCLGAAEAVLIMVQQHNIKEEQILYPMGDRLLGAGAAAVLEQVCAVLFAAPLDGRGSVS
ncbi:MAG TPA: hemerythrin domain-containing protein [Gammaproteobacteria bacterium]|nr:hemerythrin domain-containing protein [Gammaproteobacteria bacterium]